MAVLLGLASALVYGAADFLGGMQARRSGALAVVVWSQLAAKIPTTVPSEAKSTIPSSTAAISANGRSTGAPTSAIASTSSETPITSAR